LSLGGGAARGLAHIGVLKVLEEEAIPIASICGSSMGAFVGGLFALHGNTKSIIRIVKDYIESEQYAKSTIGSIPPDDDNLTFRQKIKRGILMGKSIAFGKVIPFEEWSDAMKEMVPDKRFKHTQIPFYATGLDLTQKKEVLFVDGNLRSAIVASCSIPGVFPPVRSGNSIYVDGGWVDKVPVRPLLQMGARTILAVDVSNQIEVDNEESKTPGYSIILKAYGAVQRRLDQVQIEQAPLCWKLPVDHIEWSNFSKLEALIEHGEVYTREHLHEIHELLKMQSFWWSSFDRIRKRKFPKWSKPPGYKPIELRSIGEIGPIDS